MKKSFHLFSVILICGLILAACTSTTPTQPAAPQVLEPAATQAPATEAAVATEAVAAATEPSAGVEHTAIPGTPPTSGGEKWSDHSTASSINPGRALIGDDF